MQFNHRFLGLALALAGAIGATPAAAGCATLQDAPCEVASGNYDIALPDNVTAGPIPVVMFLHGAGGSGAGTMRNTGMVNRILERGYAVIAPTAEVGHGQGGHWNFQGAAQGRDELAFLTEVMADATARFNVDPTRSILAGFSVGGSMTSYIACEAPDAFSAFAPISGSFWEPMPEACAGPVRLLHTHGWSDGTVPLEGRPLRGGALIQGDVFQSMQIWRAANSCTGLKADEFVSELPFLRRSWTRCTPGSALEFALFMGGHMIPAGWVDLTLGWFEALPPRS